MDKFNIGDRVYIASAGNVVEAIYKGIPDNPYVQRTLNPNERIIRTVKGNWGFHRDINEIFATAKECRAFIAANTNNK